MNEIEQKQVFAENLNHYIESREKTQLEIANSIGVSPQTFNTWVKGIAIPRMGKIQKLADYFRINKSDLIDVRTDSDHLPSNAILPSAKAVPIMGTICAGDGVVCEDDYSGNFIIDTEIKADYCLRVRGYSMQEANIYDGDLVFIKKDCDVENGKIYAVERLDTNEAYLKKVTLQKDSIILTPCNARYQPIVTDYSEIRIVGECVGVFHRY